MNADRWQRLMRAWGLPPGMDTWSALLAAYGEKHRHYHTGEHVDACLRHLDACVRTLQWPREVELALWFHDAVHRPLSSRNEQASADWARRFLATGGVSRDAAERVVELIMATRHEAPVAAGDAAVLVDIDLAILGADPDTYAWFEQAVRREYRHVPALLYRRGRGSLLRKFLERPRIYQTEAFAPREARARANLTAAVVRLEQS